MLIENVYHQKAANKELVESPQEFHVIYMLSKWEFQLVAECRRYHKSKVVLELQTFWVGHSNIENLLLNSKYGALFCVHLVCFAFLFQRNGSVHGSSDVMHSVMEANSLKMQRDDIEIEERG